MGGGNPESGGGGTEPGLSLVGIRHQLSEVKFFIRKMIIKDLLQLFPAGLRIMNIHKPPAFVVVETSVSRSIIFLTCSGGICPLDIPVVLRSWIVVCHIPFSRNNARNTSRIFLHGTVSSDNYAPYYPPPYIHTIGMFIIAEADLQCRSVGSMSLPLNLPKM